MVLSEDQRGRPDARDWLRSVDPDQVFPSVVTLGEIKKGISRKTLSDLAAAVSPRRRLEQLRVDHACRILPITDEIALEWGRIAAMRPRDIADAMIAATASVHRKAIVMRNVAHFTDLDVPIIDPWNPE